MNRLEFCNLYFHGPAVRGSPDPAHKLTVGLPATRFAPTTGDLRSVRRRGRETRAEPWSLGLPQDDMNRLEFCNLYFRGP